MCVVVQARRAAVIGRMLIALRTGPKNKVILSAMSHHSTRVTAFQRGNKSVD